MEKQQTYLDIEQVEKDEQYRKSQLDLGWTEAYCRCLDFLTKIDISHNAPYHQRNRYDNTITMKSSDPNHQSGPMWQREDCRATPKALVNLRVEHGRNPTFIPKHMRTRQRNTLDPDLRRILDCLSENRKTFLPTSSSSSSSLQNWWQHDAQDSKT